MLRKLGAWALALALLLGGSSVAAAKFIKTPETVTLQGILYWETELEGPHWEVNGVVLLGWQYDQLSHLEEQEVIVTGYYSDMMTIYQKTNFVVESVKAAGKIELVGEVAFTDLEGGMYSVSGWALAYDRDELKKYLGQKVWVKGTEADASIYGGPTLVVEAIELIELPPRSGPAPRPVPPPVIRVRGHHLVLNVDTGLPRLEEGRYLVPLRAIAEALGAQVTWEAETGRIYVNTNDRGVVLQPGSLEVQVGGKLHRSEVAPQLIGGRTLVPLRLLSEGLGWSVTWNQAAEEISID